MTPLDDSYDLALAAATLRSNGTDVQVLLRALTVQLADTLGARLRVKRASGRLRKSDSITSVAIAMGNEQYEATVADSSLACTIGRLSGGIRIRSESVDVDQWLVRLLGALRDEAAHSESARLALENIVIGGNP